MPSTLFQRRAMAAALAACFPGLVWGAVARVDFAVGEVSALSADGRSRTLAKGSEIEVGETVRIAQGRAQLRFTDGALMSLQPGTEFKIEQYRFAGKEDGSESVVMNLVKGGMRTITGLIGRANRQNYKLVTDVATIGIRGTEYSVRYTNSIEVFCAGGAIFVQNEGGTLQLNGGEGARVLNVQTPPARTSEPPVLAPQSATTRGQQEEQEQQQQPAPPQNPTQDRQPVVTEKKVVAQLPPEPVVTPPVTPPEPMVTPPVTPPPEPLVTPPTPPVTPPVTPPPEPPAPPPPLTGTFAANWAVGATGTENQAWIGHQATLDASGKAIAFSNFEGPFDIGTASAQSHGNDGVIAWGRWLNGTTYSLPYPNGNTYFGNRTLTETAVMHYAVGVPVTNMPASGTATYSMIGHTPPSWSGLISSAAVNASSLLVSFASLNAWFSLDMMIDGQRYASAIPLTRYTDHQYGPGVPSAGGANFYGEGSFGSYSYDSLRAAGFLSGEGAARAGVVYRGYIYEQGEVYGAIALAKDATALLTGTYPGNWTAVRTSSFDYQPWIDASVTLDGAGKATAFANTVEGPVGIGTASAQSSGNDGIIAWGRWVNGTTSGSNWVYGGQALTASEVLHYAVALPATNVPASGTASYTMLGATPPSFNGAVTSAAVHGSSIVVNFASTQAAFHLDMSINGNQFATAAPGITLYRSGARYTGGDSLTVPGFTNHSIYVSAFLAGDGAARAGASYKFNLDASSVAGAIAYRR